MALSGNKEGNVADAWKKLCGRDYEQLVNDCMTVRKEKRLSDWAYLLFTKQIGVQLYGAEHTNEIVFLQMFLNASKSLCCFLANSSNSFSKSCAWQNGAHIRTAKHAANKRFIVIYSLWVVVRVSYFINIMS